MSIAMTDEQRAVQAAIRQWAAAADPIAGVRARESDAAPLAEPAGWSGLAEIGVFAIALPVGLGGADGGVDDLAAALAETAAVLAPGPILSTTLAVLLLRSAPAHAALLADVGAGRATVGVQVGGSAVAADPGGADGDHGELVLRGECPVVLGAGETTHVLLSATVGGVESWFVVPSAAAGVTVRPSVPVDHSRALGAVRLDGVRVAASAAVSVDVALVGALLATLAAAEAAGVAGWCLRTATEYAGVREQFGRPIGAFQAVKHLCAGMLCRVERAAAVAWDAARAVDEPDGGSGLPSAVAAAIALDAAVECAKDCVQVLGGIGFTWEHDAHRYLRRALALRQLVGPVDARRRVARLALSGIRRALGVQLSEVDEAGRAAIRATVGDLAGLPADEQRKALAANGFLAPHWPRPYGLDASAATQVLIEQELDRAGVTRPDLVIGGWAAPTILRHGTDAQRDRLVGPTLTGEITWCQLFSEPGAGSDLASLRTRAVRADGGWRITGQKVWTSLAQHADHAILLARTDPDAPPHKGITYFVLDMSAPGITIRPLREITGEERFNEVFLDDVFVPDDGVVGEVHGGWRLARTTLANERVAMGGRSAFGEQVERLLGLVAERGLDADPGVLDRIGGLVAEGMVVSLLDQRATLRRLDGADPGAESGIRKLVGVWHRQAVAETALDLLGPDGAAVTEVSAPVLHEFLLSRCLSIAGGTTQILLNVAAERILGLPRG